MYFRDCLRILRGRKGVWVKKWEAGHFLYNGEVDMHTKDALSGMCWRVRAGAAGLQRAAGEQDGAVACTEARPGGGHPGPGRLLSGAAGAPPLNLHR